MPNGGTRAYSSSPTYGVRRSAKKGARHIYRGLWFSGIGNVKVHIMVCEAFHGPKPFPKAVVLHEDENGENNIPSNLRWGTQKENLNAPGFIAYCQSRTGDNNPYRKGRLQRVAGVA
jgi:hypothetical protein